MKIRLPKRGVPMMGDRSDTFDVIEIEPGNWAVMNGSVVVKRGLTNRQAWYLADRSRRFRAWERERKQQR